MASGAVMKILSDALIARRPLIAWLCGGLAGVIAPALALIVLTHGNTPQPSASLAGTVMAVAMMAGGMITAAASGSLRVGAGLAVVTGTGLALLARALGLPSLPNPAWGGTAMIIAATSFAARGALFARSAADRGWIIAIAVVAGEAAIVATALADPQALPEWLLALLPAQWASIAIGAALAGTGGRAAFWALCALAGTAAATLLVASLWPRRWPYLMMFTTWLGLSALVFYQP